jgi:two-component system chemotaxis response regulator CheY
MLKTILVVDDSQSIREAVGFTLQNEGYNVLKAEHGKDALRFFNSDAIDLVITDLHMPEMNGIELTAEIRKLPEYSRIPVLVLTTESQAEIKMEAKKAGATGWIVKPFVHDTLLAMIRKVIR